MAATGRCPPIAIGLWMTDFSINLPFASRLVTDVYWPVPAVQAMKSIRGCSTATCDPNATFVLEQNPKLVERLLNPVTTTAATRRCPNTQLHLVTSSLYATCKRLSDQIGLKLYVTGLQLKGHWQYPSNGASQTISTVRTVVAS